MDIKQLYKLFTARFTTHPIIVRSPGRINIIGEHTDYNEGFVLPAAIDKAAYLAIALREDDTINLIAHDLDESFDISINDIKPQDGINWPNYVLGVLAQFKKKGVLLKGFDAILHSDVPIGAGLSSSAALECATAFALNELLKTEFERITLVKMAQQAEHDYAGVKCGIMDQFASMMGKKDYLIKLDCRSLEYEYVPCMLEGYKILLLNTNLKHSLATSEYNTRRKECEQAVSWVKEQYPDVKSLRDVTEDMLDECVLPKDKLIDNRSRFVVQEINRLVEGCKDLQQNNFVGLGKKMFETHNGLSKMYAVSCKELDFLVDFVKDQDAVSGARMMGGGFGGCTINLVKESAIDGLVAAVKPAYEDAMNLPLTYYVASIQNGTEIL
jgi:galactokinase